MRLIPCKQCGQLISERAETCGYCGSSQEELALRPKKRVQQESSPTPLSAGQDHEPPVEPVNVAGMGVGGWLAGIFLLAVAMLLAGGYLVGTQFLPQYFSKSPPTKQKLRPKASVPARQDPETDVADTEKTSPQPSLIREMGVHLSESEIRDLKKETHLPVANNAEVKPVVDQPAKATGDQTERPPASPVQKASLIPATLPSQSEPGPAKDTEIPKKNEPPREKLLIDQARYEELLAAEQKALAQFAEAEKHMVELRSQKLKTLRAIEHCNYQTTRQKRLLANLHTELETAKNDFEQAKKNRTMTKLIRQGFKERVRDKERSVKIAQKDLDALIEQQQRYQTQLAEIEDQLKTAQQELEKQAALVAQTKLHLIQGEQVQRKGETIFMLQEKGGEPKQWAHGRVIAYAPKYKVLIAARPIDGATGKLPERKQWKMRGLLEEKLEINTPDQGKRFVFLYRIISYWE